MSNTAIIDKKLSEDEGKWVRLKAATTKKAFEYKVNKETISIRTVNSDPMNPNAMGKPFDFNIKSVADLYDYLSEHKGWQLLGSKKSNRLPAQGTVEKWSRSKHNPVKGYYGLTPSKEGSFSTFIPSILAHYGLIEIEGKNEMTQVKVK